MSSSYLVWTQCVCVCVCVCVLVKVPTKIEKTAVYVW